MCRPSRPSRPAHRCRRDRDRSRRWAASLPSSRCSRPLGLSSRLRTSSGRARRERRPRLRPAPVPTPAPCVRNVGEKGGCRIRMARAAGRRGRGRGRRGEEGSRGEMLPARARGSSGRARPGGAVRGMRDASWARYRVQIVHPSRACSVLSSRPRRPFSGPSKSAGVMPAPPPDDHGNSMARRCLWAPMRCTAVACVPGGWSVRFAQTARVSPFSDVVAGSKVRATLSRARVPERRGRRGSSRLPTSELSETRLRRLHAWRRAPPPSSPPAAAPPLHDR